LTEASFVPEKTEKKENFALEWKKTILCFVVAHFCSIRNGRFRQHFYWKRQIKTFLFKLYFTLNTQPNNNNNTNSKREMRNKIELSLPGSMMGQE